MEGSKRQIILENPPLEKAYRTVKREISRRRTVLVVGNCWAYNRSRRNLYVGYSRAGNEIDSRPPG